MRRLLLQKKVWRRIMENKNRDSDRDKMLEDILSKLGAQEKNS